MSKKGHTGVHSTQAPQAQGPIRDPASGPPDSWQTTASTDPSQGLVDGLGVGAFIHWDGRPLFLNSSLAALLGFGSPEEALAEPVLLAGLMAMQSESTPTPLELQVLRRDGMPVWVEVSAAPIRWMTGPATLATIVDVTGRKTAEYALQTCERRWQQAEEVAQLGIWEYSVDTRRSHWSTGMYGIFGIAPSAVAPAGLDFFPHVHPDDRQRMRSAFDGSFRQGQDYSAEMRILRADGVTRHCRCRWSVERRPSGKPVRMFGVLADITDMKLAEFAARDRQRLLETVLATVPYMVSAKDAEGRIILANPQLADRLGVPLPELVHARISELPHLDQAFRDKIEREDREVLATGRPMVLEAVQGRLPGAMDRWHRVIKLPLADDAGRMVGVVGLAEDITDRMEAERRRGESQQLLRDVLDSIPYSVFVKGTDGRYILANAVGCKAVGLSHAEVVGKRSEEIPGVVREVADAMNTIDAAVLASGKTSVQDGVRSLMQRYAQRSFRVIKAPLHNAEGQITGIIGVAEDVTERLESQSRLRASEHLLQTIVDTLPENVALKDRDGRYLLVNEQFAKVHGLSKAEALGKRATDFAFWPEHTQRWVAMDRVVLEHGVAVTDIDHKVKHADGTTSLRVLHKVPFRDERGEIVGILAVSRDITARKQAEHNLQSNERLLQMVIDALPVTISLVGRDGRIRLVNEAFARIRGVTKEASLGKRYEEVYRWPQHTPRWLEMEAAALQSGEPQRDIDHELEHADGGRTSRELHKLPFRGESGEITGVLSVSYDVTERQAAERRMREQSHLLQTLIDTIPHAVFLKDLQGNYLVVNEAYARAHAITKDAALQSRLEDLPGGGPEKPDWLDADRQVLETGQPVYLEEVPFTLPSGEVRLRTLYKFPFWNQGGDLVGILGVSDDITDRKRDQLALFQAQKMESLGLLAGGVAHDFNNLLMAISGNTLLALADLPAENPAASSLRNIQHATEMAAGLTRQMLAIAGKGKIQSRPVDVSRLAGNIAQLLRAVVSKLVELRQEFTDDLSTITADPSQIQQLVMNLVKNAADAIAAEGVITIRTGQFFASKAYLAECQFGGQQEERLFVYIEVSDTGFGMSSETVQRIFDPFYTTKVTGRGLGLAAVLAIVRSHRGALRVSSQLGEGTTFRILLPADVPKRQAPREPNSLDYQR